jgi:hypothetical protein
MYDVLRRTMLTDDARTFLGADGSTGPCAGGEHLWVGMRGMPELEVLSCLACATLAVRTEHPAR